MARVALAGLPIAVTGASSGIGWHTAVACARAGMPVAVAARRADRLAELVATIQREGGRAVAVTCDVTRPEDCRALIDRTSDAFGSVYAVFANAGYGIEGPVLGTTDEQFRSLFETNFYGTLHTIRPAAERMLAAGRGHILICSSVVSKLGIPTMAAYSASKAMQDHVGRAMRAELAGRVFVSTVHPISTETEFSSTVQERSGNRPRTARAPRAMRQTPERVAAAVVACLRRPRGEVWTSFTARMLGAVAAAAPEFTDWVLRRKFPPAPDST